MAYAFAGIIAALLIYVTVMFFMSNKTVERVLDESVEKITKKVSRKPRFIDNYRWCTDNFTLKYRDLLKEHDYDVTDFTTDKWDYHYPYKLSEYWTLYGFDDLKKPNTRVVNGRIYSCTHVDQFIDEFNEMVDRIRCRFNSDDVKLYKKYYLSYQDMLTRGDKHTYNEITLNKL